MVTEKHKLNVPETMAEVLDVSDEEGETCFTLEPVDVKQHAGQVIGDLSPGFQTI